MVAVRITFSPTLTLWPSRFIASSASASASTSFLVLNLVSACRPAVSLLLGSFWPNPLGFKLRFPASHAFIGKRSRAT
ncbi:uncharacterized protein BO97DRAFT_5578 [Aspergillus homomorphus CBS 101889]|uniref:Uncharacterized protein n=1 Tax=Aspergillus homomorphus (strain CBS 101889) TaxID=1450537 RepID=A0A395IBL8_ASPHC|nr:hypothetical protein BO97DRAFT_5578 [Aspergillus homomorphus CBS 101889]RAL17375.1 hypothetical protein BO97DRAFT_5578 [Aspergillus homomorphus CBS 101889]